MNPGPIAEVTIAPDGRLLVFPTANSYPNIYLEGVEVHWDAGGRYLYSPKPREWSYLDWFRQIINVAGDLALSSDTKWTNIPDDLRHEAGAWMRNGNHKRRF
ncbi:MAG: hypothetical protein ABIS50_10320 [Luteolibacter sp.]|uniref:hypothetical protein n=1 Tax=Luteolibacter sp. TaxID=1962973 RepID=UPI003264D7FF